MDCGHQGQSCLGLAIHSLRTLLGSFADLWAAVQRHKQCLVSNSLSRRQLMAIRLLGRVLTCNTGSGWGSSSSSSWMPGRLRQQADRSQGTLPEFASSLFMGSQQPRGHFVLICQNYLPAYFHIIISECKF